YFVTNKDNGLVQLVDGIIPVELLPEASRGQHATEEIAGIAEIATIQEVLEGTDRERFITPYGLKNIYNQPYGIASLDSEGHLSSIVYADNSISSSKILTNDKTPEGGKLLTLYPYSETEPNSNKINPDYIYNLDATKFSSDAIVGAGIKVVTTGMDGKIDASDLDVTLYFGREIGIKKEDALAIKQFQKEGNLFGICTGRPLIGLLNTLQNQIQCDFYILSTGALIVDKDLKEIFSKPLDYELAYDLWMQYKDLYNMVFQIDGKVYTLGEPIPFPIKQIYVDDFTYFKDKSIMGIAIQCKSDEEAHSTVKDIMNEYDVSAVSNSFYVDVIHKGCNKGSAIKELKNIYKIDTMMAIGDEHNDIDMLKEADLSFSFTYSPDKVKESSTYVVNSIEEAIKKINL
ncbi:MAG: HAD-IIB family hydrolase, partial [Holdemanella sp.]|nr:HAD-IIB family hydrolase [Holdemanella sp.]